MDSDSFVYNSSIEKDDNTRYFIDKRWTHIIDENSGGYSGGQIRWSSSPISNSGLFADYRQGYIQIPLVMSMVAADAKAESATFQALNDSFAVGMKNAPSIIHSVSVDFNNETIVQQTPYINQYINFRLHQKLSKDSVDKLGDFLNWHPDGSGSATYNPATVPSPAGHGHLNNVSYSVKHSDDTKSYANMSATETNEGLLARQMNTAFNGLGASNTSVTGENGKQLIPEDVVQSMGKSIYQRKNLDEQYWFCTATLFLKDLADIFDKLPLCRGLFAQITLNVCTSVQNIKIEKFDGGGDVSCTSSICPNQASVAMISASGITPKVELINDAAGAAAGDQANFTLSVDIAKNVTTGVSHPVLPSNCRLYVPLYQLDPKYENSYLSLRKTSKITYSDVYNYNFTVNTSSGQGTCNILLNNGIAKPRSLVLMCFPSASSNYTGIIRGVAAGAETIAKTNGIPPYQSPFDSSPGGTVGLGIILKNFQVQVGQSNIWNEPQNYDWQQFLHEVSPDHTINGAQTYELMNAGLGSYRDWQLNKRFYYCDLSRCTEATDMTARSVSISTEVFAPYNEVQVLAFLTYEKEIGLDLSTGALLS